MRYIVSEHFEKLMKDQRFEEIAVVGGTENEPELAKLPSGMSYKVTYYGIEKNPEQTKYLDLNLDNEINETFDLVLCSQVFEHLYDLNNALTNLIKMCSKETILWLNFPTSNRAHGSPEYYCAGYTSEALFKLLKSKVEFETMAMENIGTKRNYFFTHALRIWPSEKELQNPILNYEFGRYPYSTHRKLLTYFKQLPLRIYSLFLSNKISNNVEYATESILVIRNIKEK